MASKATDTCMEHCGFKKDISRLNQDVKTIFCLLGKKVPLWSFILLITLIVSQLGIQWASYQKASEISTQIAVMEQRVTSIERQGKQEARHGQ